MASSPGVLLGCIWLSALVTPFGVNSAKRWSFIYSITIFILWSRKERSVRVSKVVNSCLKNSMIMWSLLSSVCHLPSWFFICVKWLFLFLWEALLWKYLVFWSPSSSYKILDLRVNTISSLLSHCWTYALALLNSFILRHLGCTCICFLRFLLALCMFCLTNLNVVLFHSTSWLL